MIKRSSVAVLLRSTTRRSTVLSTSATRPCRRLPLPFAPLPLRQGSTQRTLHHASTALPANEDIDGTYQAHTSATQATPLTSCPGCGALAQTVLAGEAGFYSTKRKRVQTFLDTHAIEPTPASKEHEVYNTVSGNAGSAVLEAMGLSASEELKDEKNAITAVPFCDRCHDLIHHQTGQSVAHPSMQSIKDTISESAFKRNHVYHVLDAADFPLSLVRNIHRIVSAAPQRSRNRRARQTAYIGGRLTEVSFVITRSDLLAPKKEQVDRLMPYLLRVLRDALGRSGAAVRLGNVRCVSAKRGWWTKELKSTIWTRGGAGWMLGKVNVGKSNLYEAVFPKGRKDEDISIDAVRNAARKLSVANARLQNRQSIDMRTNEEDIERPSGTQTQQNYLLPPARAETAYPLMPTVSALPGTTASPIRIPFGGGRGELIDLPGLSRGDVERFVLPEHRQSLMMKSRVVPDQLTIKPGQSLMLGGLVRITPRQDELIILAHAFVPIKAHVTSTEKALKMETDPSNSGVPLLIGEDFKTHVRSAGIFPLRWDVTKQRTGPLTARSAVGLKPQQLPFRVLATDILIEGIGWIELAAQVRAKHWPHTTDSLHPKSTSVGGSTPKSFSSLSNLDPQFPEVEVFSPDGEFIGARESMVASSFEALVRTPVSKRKGRPRQSMRSVKSRRLKS